MCGLVGMAGPLTGKKEQVIKTLLILDALRGIDSTGIAVVGRNFEVKMAKALGDPYQLLDTPVFNKAMNGVNSLIIGHNRWGTVGGNSRHTVHPFDVGTIVGAHNGTVTSKWKLKDANSFKTDSEAIFNSMQEVGLRETVDLLEGAWALVWYDAVYKTINFLRNKERPLYFVTDEEGCLYWASEKWMLSVALSRHDIKHQEILEVPVDQHIRSEIGSDGIISKPLATEMKAKPPVIYTYVKQESKVEKKETPPFQLVAVTPPPSLASNVYSGKTDVKLEIVGRRIDKSGAPFVRCFDPEERNRIIRLYYFTKTDPVDLWESQDIIATIGKITQDKFSMEYFYKVVHSSVRLATPLPEDKSYKDSKGNLLTKKEWEDKYQSCNFCTSPIDADQKNLFTSEGDIICQRCCEDEQVSQYINLVH